MHVGRVFAVLSRLRIVGHTGVSGSLAAALHTMNEKGKKVTQMKACTYQVGSAKHEVYNFTTLGNVRIRLAKHKKGCFWGFVANEDDKEDKKKKKKKKA